MIELRTLLHAHLKSALRPHEYYGFVAPTQVVTFSQPTPGVYFQRAPAKAEMPYLVYSVDALSDGEGFEIITLVLEGWDAPENKDSRPLERLMIETNKALNKQVLMDETLTVAFYLDNRFPLLDENPQILRWRYTYQGRLFERGDN